MPGVSLDNIGGIWSNKYNQQQQRRRERQHLNWNDARNIPTIVYSYGAGEIEVKEVIPIS